MRITFIASGTRGDVQPVLRLAMALRERGHAVRLMASASFRSWIEQHGLQAAAARVDIQEVMLSEGGRRPGDAPACPRSGGAHPRRGRGGAGAGDHRAAAEGAPLDRPGAPEAWWAQ